MKCFVTVGSTQFEKLIFTILTDDILQQFSNIGINKLIVQNGSGKIPECLNYIKSPEGEEVWEAKLCGVEVVLFRYKNSIQNEMEDSDLIIGHAGAGTCLEVLDLGKPFIAIINNSLMDNHQSELAQQLAKDGHLICTIPENLKNELVNPTLFNLKLFPKIDTSIFYNFLKEFLE